MTEWRRYMNSNGDLEFPKYLYKMLTDLMKTTLDLGTMVCTDQNKLRAFKEQVKVAHNRRWEEIASAFEYLDVIEPCICAPDKFCKLCGGSRYILSDVMNADQIVWRSEPIVDKTDEIANKLREGMEQAQRDILILEQNRFANKRGGING